MKPEVRFRSEAAQDVVEAFSWYESQRPGLGAQFEAAVDHAVSLLRRLPQAGPVVHREVRRILLRRFPYAVYYLLNQDVIDVLAVMHMHRDPSRWRRRAR